MKLLLVDFTAVFSIHITDQVYKQIPGNYFVHMLEFKTAKCGKGWEQLTLTLYSIFYTCPDPENPKTELFSACL